MSSLSCPRVPRLPATLLVLAVTALAATLPLSPASADEAPPFCTVELDNGLTLLLAPSAAHPVISLACYVTTGGRTEDEYYQGSLHYIEHLIFKGGTPNLAPTEFRRRMNLLGREAGGWTWDDEINFGFQVPQENFVTALGVFREALLDLEFEQEWFESEKLVVAQEMTRGREEPGDLIYEMWGESAYNVHPYRRPVIGSEKAIRELDMERTHEYYANRFSPNHMILALVGDFEEDEMVGWIEAEWGGETPGPESFELGLVEPEQLGPRSRTDFMPQATTALLLTGLVGPGGDHADTPALEMLAALMNDDSYGLPQYLIEQEKWVTSVRASDYVKRDASDFYVHARLAPENCVVVTRFVQDFMLEFDVAAIPVEIFEQTRQRLLFEEARERESAADRASRLGLLVSRRGLEAARDLTSRYRTLTPADVQAAQQRWLRPRRLVTATIYPDTFDLADTVIESIMPRAPAPPPLPDLAVPGGLLPAAAAPLDYAPTDAADGVSLYTFANGLRLLVKPTDASALLAISGRVLGGQWIEPVDQAGINLFVAEIGMRATRRWDREGFGRLLAAHSLSASAHRAGYPSSSSRQVHYRDAGAQHYFGLEEEWPTMLAALKETLFFPAFEPTEVKKLREDLVARADRLLENNLDYIKQEFYNIVYAGHPYGKATFGTAESLRGITLDDLRAFHAEHWTPAHTVVAVVGDVDADAVATWIAAHWADLGPRHAPAEPWSVHAADRRLDWKPPAERQVLALGKNYWTVNWGRPGAVAADPSYYPSLVLGSMAGNHHFYKYVYEESVSYRSWITFWDHLGPGAWIIENDVKRERFEEILGLFDEDVARYASSGFTADEFDKALRRLTNGEILGSQDNANTAWRLAVAEGNDVGFRRVTQAIDHLTAVTQVETQMLAREIFAPESLLRMVQQ